MEVCKLSEKVIALCILPKLCGGHIIGVTATRFIHTKLVQHKVSHTISLSRQDAKKTSFLVIQMILSLCA